MKRLRFSQMGFRRAVRGSHEHVPDAQNCFDKLRLLRRIAENRSNALDEISNPLVPIAWR